MKKNGLKNLFCFLILNFMFMCFAISAFAGRADYRLNGEGDGLDVVLKEMSVEDYKLLDCICEKGIFDKDGNSAKQFDDKDEKLSTVFNKEIRSNYGYSIMNIIRATEFNPGYGEILCGIAEELGIYVHNEISPDDVETIEDKVVISVVNKIKDEMNKTNDRKTKWKNINTTVKMRVDDLFKQEEYSKKDYEKIFAYEIGYFIFSNEHYLVDNRFKDVLCDAIFGEYIFKGTIFDFEFVKSLSKITWGRTNWQKTIGSVFYIALMRQKLQAEGKL